VEPSKEVYMAAPRKIIRLYALSTCTLCKKVKNFLKQRGVEYELIEVDLLDSGEQWVASKEVRKYNPEATYPTLIVQKVFTEYDEQSIVEALES